MGNGISHCLIFLLSKGVWRKKVALLYILTSNTVQSGELLLYNSILHTDLTILGAAYGRADVTHTVHRRISNYETLSVDASNTIFGDSWHGIEKSLVVVYQHQGYHPRVSITREHHTLNIDARPEVSNPTTVNHPIHQLTIVGAAYGLSEVTSKVRSLVQYEHLDVVASNDVFGDSWFGTWKTLVVVYQYGNGPYRTVIAIEGNRLRI